MSAEPLHRTTAQAIAHFASNAEREHLRLLGERRLTSTECAACARIAWPPRDFCPFCGDDRVSFVDIGEGATLYAFTQQQRALRFTAPEVIGLVDIPKVGRILSAIDAPFDRLSIGMALQVDFVEIQSGLWVHRFKQKK